MDWAQLTKTGSMPATVAFAMTAVLAIRRDRDVDLLGAVVLGLITAIGGGTIRDVILDVPVFWSHDLSFIWAATGASIVAFYGLRLLEGPHVSNVMLYLDGLGVAMFSIQATEMVWALGFGLPVAPVILGVITAIGGGLLRDTLAGRTTLLMRPELYATPVLLGCIVFVLVLKFLPAYRVAGSVLCTLGIFFFRAAAIYWDLSIPAFALRSREQQRPPRGN